MKRTFLLIIAAAFIASFALHGRVHAADHGHHPCRVCQVGQAQHIAPAPSGFNPILSLSHQTAVQALPAFSADRPALAYPRAPPSL